MIFEYYCKKCGKEWEEAHSSNNRLKPCEGPCPCEQKLEGVVGKMISQSGISYDGVKSVHTRAHPDFKERLKEIKKSSGKYHNIQD